MRLHHSGHWVPDVDEYETARGIKRGGRRLSELRTTAVVLSQWNSYPVRVWVRVQVGVQAKSPSPAITSRVRHLTECQVDYIHLQCRWGTCQRGNMRCAS